MNTRIERLPGPDHPITIERNPRAVVVRAAGEVVANSRNALRLQEASYPPVLYVPRADVDMSKLQRTDHTTFCPYKGECTYYSIPAAGETAVNAVWSYEKPFASVAQIAHHLAFYPTRVDAIEEA
jgi:uncharacterized protein (DUF427 family)